MAVERSKYREKYIQKEMTEIFESFEYRLFEKLEQADSVIVQMSEEASAVGIPSEYRVNFLREKLIDMFEQFAENRERLKPARATAAKKGGIAKCDL